MDYNEFASKIKTKYPDYSDMDNRELAQKMVAKFPEYSDVTFDNPQQEPSLLNQAADISSGIQNAVMGPVSKAIKAGAEGLSLYATGSKKPVQALAPYSTYIPEKIEQTGEYVAEKGGELGYPKTGAVAGMVVANAPYFMLPGGSPIKAGPATKAIGRGATRIGEAASGVSARDIEALFKRPSDLFTLGSQKEAGKAIGAAKLEAGVNPGITKDLASLTPENIDKALNVSKTGANALQEIGVRKTGTAEQIGDALKYVGDEIKGRLSSGKDASELINLQEHLNTMLDTVAPGVQKARQEFAPIAQRNKFLKLLPTNKNGSISKANLFYLNTIAQGITAPFRAPLTTGLATVGASVGSDVLAGTVNSPSFRKALISQFVDRVTVKNRAQ